jgi:hypothetical protein
LCKKKVKVSVYVATQTFEGSKMVKYSKMGLLGPSFGETEDEMRNQDGKRIYKKEQKKWVGKGGGGRTKLIFSIKLVRTFTPSLDLAYP